MARQFTTSPGVCDFSSVRCHGENNALTTLHHVRQRCPRAQDGGHQRAIDMLGECFHGQGMKMPGMGSPPAVHNKISMAPNVLMQASTPACAPSTCPHYLPLMRIWCLGNSACKAAAAVAARSALRPTSMTAAAPACANARTHA